MVIILETVPTLLGLEHIFENCEIFFTMFFTLEYITRVIGCEFVVEYHKNLTNVMDLVATTPWYFSLFFQTELTFVKVLRLVRLIRLFRLFRAPSLQIYTLIISSCCRKASKYVLVFFAVVCIALFILASSFFVLENDRGITLITL